MCSMSLGLETGLCEKLYSAHLQTAELLDLVLNEGTERRHHHGDSKREEGW